MAESNEYTVRWAIQICAPTPELAAQVALDIQKDPGSLATFFDVDDFKTGESILRNYEVQ